MDADSLLDAERQYIALRNYKINQVSEIIGRILIDYTHHHDIIIVANYINPLSCHIIYDGGTPKPYFINAKTEQAGLLGGYIIDNQNHCRKSKIIEVKTTDKTLVFYRDNNDTHVKMDEKYKIVHPIQACVDNNKRFLTSDLDLITIGYKRSISQSKKEDLLNVNLGMGAITETEYQIATSINELFTLELSRTNKNLDKRTIYLISHGPFSRYNKSTLEDIRFPIKIYHPGRGAFTLGEEDQRKQSIVALVGLFKQFQLNGYNMTLNPNWNL